MNRSFRLLLPLLFVTFAALRSEAAEPAPTSWRSGTGREKITPQEPLWMTGYAVRTRPNDTTAQELWTKALAVQDPAGNRGVLISVDVCGFPREVSERVAAELQRRFKIPRSAVMTNASHTHCSPSVEGFLAGLRLVPEEDRQRLIKYRAHLETQMVAAAAHALESLAPASLTWGEDAATFGINRRNNVAAQLPAAVAAGTVKGPSDPRVPVLAVRSATGEVKALLVSYACHNTTLSLYAWHGDYAGCAQEELERRHAGATVLFASGCGADINPFPRGEIAHAEAHGRALADATDRALASTMRPVAGTFTSAMADIPLTFSGWPTDEALRQAREKEQPNKEMYQAWAYVVAKDRLERRDQALTYSYPIQTWRLGPLSWVALGGEVVVDYSLALRKEFGPELWAFGYSTDVMCYIPNERVLEEGRYEGDTSMIAYGKPGKWTPGLEERIMTKTRELLSATRAAK